MFTRGTTAPVAWSGNTGSAAACRSWTEPGKRPAVGWPACRGGPGREMLSCPAREERPVQGQALPG